MKTLLILLSGILIMSCSSHRMNGTHQSILKQEEINKHSNYDLRFSKAVIHDNQKHKHDNQKKAQAYQQAVAKDLNEINKKKSPVEVKRKKNNLGKVEFY